jgi:GH25 family lysozyme M1 (1,4-beta-N-acetylmuramidase)
MIPDLSEYQKKIDFDAFCAGCDFAIFRARVNGKDDKKFKAWAAACRKRNFPFAAYDYVRLRSVEDAVKQAEMMYARAAPYFPTIFYIDAEKKALGVGYKRDKQYLAAYIARLRELGVRKIGLYMGDYRYRAKGYSVIGDTVDTLWIANYGKNDGTVSAKPKTKCDLHQYTSHGHTKAPGAPGCLHRIDLNRLTGRKPLSWFTGLEG